MKLLAIVTLLLCPALVYAGDVSDYDAEKNKKLVLSVFEALENGDLALLNKVFASEGKSIIGSEERNRGGPFDTFAKAAPFPAALDKRDVKVESIFSEGNKVAIQSMICGVHARELVGYKPTGQKLCARYTNLYTIKDGRILENVVGFDPQLRKTLESNNKELKKEG